MNEELIQKIRQTTTLPSLPAVAMQVLDLAQREEVDISEIARIISRDAALSGKILRTVNSSFYGRSQSISTISHALVILGLQSVKTLVLGFSLVSNLSKSKTTGFKHIVYWKRSVYAATAARTIAKRLNLVQQEECFLAALLKDIGMLVLDQALGEEYGAIYEKSANHLELAANELAELGLTHADVSGIVAESWKLPPLLSVPMAWHHNAAAVQDPALKKLAELVYVAGRCADVFSDENAAAAIAEVRKACRAAYQMSDADADAMLDEIGKRTKEVAGLFDISIGSGVTYEAILKRANEALVELTLRSQQQAVTLKEENQVLQIKATTDGLTGLFNRAHFDQFLAEQWAAATAGGKTLSLVMLDIDKFKSVNDTHGHQAGDMVLKAVAMVVKCAARSQDLAARYGGEELALVLPGTTRAAASAIAESVRRAIEGKPVAWESKSISVTASLGVATWEPGSPLRDAGQLIKAADVSVYAAKKGGRNCVKVFAIKVAA